MGILLLKKEASNDADFFFILKIIPSWDKKLQELLILFADQKTVGDATRDIDRFARFQVGDCSCNIDISTAADHIIDLGLGMGMAGRNGTGFDGHPDQPAGTFADQDLSGYGGWQFHVHLAQPSFR